MAQHYAARADSQMLCRAGYLSHHDLGGRASEARRAVMLGQPIAAVAQPIDMAGKFDGFQQRIARGDTLTHRRLIEDAELEHGGETTRAPPELARPLLIGLTVQDQESQR